MNQGRGSKTRALATFAAGLAVGVVSTRFLMDPANRDAVKGLFKKGYRLKLWLERQYDSARESVEDMAAEVRHELTEDEAPREVDASEAPVEVPAREESR